MSWSFTISILIFFLNIFLFLICTLLRQEEIWKHPRDQPLSLATFSSHLGVLLYPAHPAENLSEASNHTCFAFMLRGWRGFWNFAGEKRAWIRRTPPHQKRADTESVGFAGEVTNACFPYRLTYPRESLIGDDYSIFVCLICFCCCACACVCVCALPLKYVLQGCPRHVTR